jgi:hypothetical protein
MTSNTSNEATPLLPVTNGQSHDSVTLGRSMSHHWDNYVVAVEKYPVTTKCITAAIILGTADMCAQGFEFILVSHVAPIRDSVDWLRTARFAAFGLFGAPWSHFYFAWLDHYLPPSEQPWTLTTFFKVCIDQFIQAPILLAIMILLLALMKGRGFVGAKQDLAHSFVQALIANCKLHCMLIQ